MNMKFIAPLNEGGVSFDVYLDLDDNKYYKINGDLKIELSEDEIEMVKAGEEYLHKVEAARRPKKKIKWKFVLALLVAGLFATYQYNEHNTEIKYIVAEQTEVGDYNLLMDFLYRNDTISDEFRIKLQEYIKVLARLDVKESKMVKIANRLARGNFKDATEKDILVYILDLKDNGFVANELYCYVNRTGVPYKQAILSDVFTLHRDAAKRLINGESISKLIKEYFGVSVSGSDLTKDDIEVVETLRTNIVKELGFIEESMGYGLNNNIFEEYVRIGFGTHNFYGKQTLDGLDNMTQSVYYKKLERLFYDNAKYIDYTNQDDRFIVYLYANSLLFGDFHNFDISVPELLYGAVKSNMDNIGILPINEEEMYSYLENPKLFRYDNVTKLSQLAYLGETGIYILQEVNLCFREELKVGNITQEQYDKFMDEIFTILKSDYPELVDFFFDHVIKNKSIDGFQIQLVNPEL